MKKTIRQAAGALCAIFSLINIFALFPSPAFAASETETVRVGFFAFDGYHMLDEHGNRSGYGYELLQHIAGYAGLRYEYVGYDKSWSEMQDMLANGEIDLLTSAQKTDERLRRFDFSASDVGVSAAILTAKAGDYAFMPEDYGNWNGIRIGMLRGNSRNDGLKKFAQEHGFVYEPVYFDGTDEMIDALKSKDDIDAILTSSLRRISGESVLAQFDPSQFYVMVQKGNTELLEKIDYALSQIDIYEPDFRSRLLKKYYPTTNTAEIFYSAQELAYIEEMRGATLKALICPDRAPYSYVKDGTLTGSMYDAAAEMISRSGLSIEFIMPADRAEYWQLVADGAADIRFDSEYSYNHAEATGCWQTPPYVKVPVARLYREDISAFDSVAVLRNSDIARTYSDVPNLQGLEVSYYDSVEEAADAVLGGKSSMALLPLSTAAVAVRDDETNRLVSEIIYGYTTSYSIAVSMEQSPLLFSILSKAVASLSEQDMDAFSLEYADDMEKPFTLLGYIYDYPLHMVLTVVSVSFLLILCASLLNMFRRRRADLAQMQHDRLKNEQLQEALHLAKEADAAKSSFMSRMSHEIRTPLNAVIGYNLIARTGMTEAKTDAERRQAEMKVIDCLTKSDIASRHLLTIINDVLDMSAIESGKLKAVHERFDFKGLISSLTTVFYTQAKTKGVELEVVFDTPTEEWFVGDQLRTNQIITNLLSNAVKFTSEGGIVRLVIRQSELREDSALIQFEVSDTGIGMSKEYMEHLWSPFEQADSSISRRFGGTGLGLSITKSLVDLMGGTIEVESEPGKGSRFTVSLTYTRTSQPENKGSVDFGSVKALVVDDDPSTCDYIRLLFDRFGARSSSVTSGEAAIEEFSHAIAQGEPYTVCLVDWRMPMMDGLETVRHLRRIAGDDIPIIVITAYDFAEVADKASELGVSSFVSKPLFQSSLFNLLANICGHPMAAKREKDERFDFGGARVLLAEDNQMNMEIAVQILESAGITVDSAWNGQEAVERFEAAPSGTYKAILMDVQMPVMDGHQATRAIRASAHSDAEAIPIIAMTADAFAENIAEAMSAGMNAHVSKPIDVPTLYATLSRFLSSSI